MEKKIKIQITEEEKYYASYIPEHDIYFSTPKEKGINEVRKRAKILIECKKDFEIKYGWMLNIN